MGEQVGAGLWGYSSVGRAPALQAGGQEFDSPHLHHLAVFLTGTNFFSELRTHVRGDIGENPFRIKNPSQINRSPEKRCGVNQYFKLHLENYTL